MVISSDGHPWRCASGLLVAAAALCLAAAASAAGWHPAGTVELVVGTAPGSGVDRPARIIQKLFRDEHIVDAAVTVVNKPGAGGALAYGYVAHQCPGTCLSVAAPTLLTNFIAGKSSVPYTQLSAVALLASEYVAFAVETHSTLRDARDLAALLRKDARAPSIGIGTSVGNNNHIAIAEFARHVGASAARLKTVVFKSPGEVITALLGRHLDIAVLGASNVVAQLRRGEAGLRVLGIAAPQRGTGLLADVPTLREQGMDVVTRQWRAIVGPKAMKADEIAYWDDAFARLVATPAWQHYLAGAANEGTYMNAAQTEKFLAAENDALAATLRDIGLAKAQ